MWIEQYGFQSRTLADGSDSGKISKRLCALKRPTKAQVEDIIGATHGGWTTVWCSSCHEYVPEAVSFSGDVSVGICRDCLVEAANRLKR